MVMVLVEHALHVVRSESFTKRYSRAVETALIKVRLRDPRCAYGSRRTDPASAFAGHCTAWRTCIRQGSVPQQAGCEAQILSRNSSRRSPLGAVSSALLYESCYTLKHVNEPHHPD